jgi:hypothetical protein
VLRHSWSLSVYVVHELETFVRDDTRKLQPGETVTVERLAIATSEI